jgi:hypothetical protein
MAYLPRARQHPCARAMHAERTRSSMRCPRLARRPCPRRSPGTRRRRRRRSTASARAARAAARASCRRRYWRSTAPAGSSSTCSRRRSGSGCARPRASRRGASSPPSRAPRRPCRTRPVRRGLRAVSYVHCKRRRPAAHVQEMELLSPST